MVSYVCLYNEPFEDSGFISPGESFDMKSSACSGKKWILFI